MTSKGTHSGHIHSSITCSQIESGQMVQWIWHSGSIWSYMLIIYLTAAHMKHVLNTLKRAAQSQRREKTPKHWLNRCSFFHSHCQCLSLMITFFRTDFYSSAMNFAVHVLVELYKCFTRHAKSIFRLAVFGTISLSRFLARDFSTFTSKSSASCVVIQFSNCKLNTFW